ncbi:hypothetical protein PF003_g4278 [Phytophthora fragariae]|nr:hypothetical protein PF003_g4278 [Phytophthora fragariae]
MMSTSLLLASRSCCVFVARATSVSTMEEAARTVPRSSWIGLATLAAPTRSSRTTSTLACSRV